MDYSNKNLVFYTNCQGGVGVNKFLSEKIKFKSSIYIETFSTIWMKRDLPVDILNNADIFIYQPINRKYGKYSTYYDVENNILKHLKKDCIKISFPYIYFACLFPLYYANNAAEIDGGSEYDISKIVNRDVILKLKKNNSKKEIIKLFNNNKIDFEFKKRYDNTIKRIKDKEKECNIKITHLFTLENIKKIKLMNTNNHPTNYVLEYITNEILKILKLEPCSFKQTKSILSSSGLPGLISIYSYNYYKFEWMKPEDTNESLTLTLLNELL
jgi:hypothetical protein